MARIIELPSHVADLIAAGEVVERPGSAVKELVENSIDAGATAITVEIRSGGMAMIRVTDNGSGIGREDAQRAFLRHATSKLRDARGLEAIGTLGFRGEALASIAAVSRIELLTREKDADEGTRLEIEGGKVISNAPAGCPVGTTMIVRDLFFNTPARLKFMKNDRAEGANVTAVCQRLALSHPEISFRYIKEGKEELRTPGDGRIESCVYAVLGREFAAGLLEANGEDEDIKVTGYISAPENCRGNRAWQFFFLNGRYIKSRLLQAALEQAFRNVLFTGKFPVCVLNIEVKLSTVDVNVHPTKMEVRFENERKVFDVVYWAVKSALEKKRGAPELKISPDTMSKVLPKSEASAGKTVKETSVLPEKGQVFYEKTIAGGDKAQGPVPSDLTARPYSARGGFKTLSAESFKKAYGGAPSSNSGWTYIKQEAERPVSLHDDIRAVYQTALEHMPEKAPGKIETPVNSKGGARIIGEAMNTYIVAEKDGCLYLIDKHAAHERIIFDRLKKEKREIPSQLLLTPAVCRMDSLAAATLLENRGLLLEYGFDVEDFGGGSVILREVPADMETGEPETTLEMLAEELQGGRRELEGLRDGILHTIACKAAIKAGKSSEPETLRELVDKVISGEVKYCPHGRPVSVEITKAQLDKSFKRT